MLINLLAKLRQNALFNAPPPYFWAFWYFWRKMSQFAERKLKSKISFLRVIFAFQAKR